MPVLCGYENLGLINIKYLFGELFNVLQIVCTITDQEF